MIIRRATLVVAGRALRRCQGAQRHGSPERCPRGPPKGGIGQRRGCQTALKCTWGANSRGEGRGGGGGGEGAGYGIASSFGRHCSALRGRTIRVVAFRASHPAKPRSRQRRFVQRFLEHHRRVSEYAVLSCLYFSHASLVGVTKCDDSARRAGDRSGRQYPMAAWTVILLVIILSRH